MMLWLGGGGEAPRPDKVLLLLLEIAGRFKRFCTKLDDNGDGDVLKSRKSEKLVFLY